MTLFYVSKVSSHDLLYGDGGLLLGAGPPVRPGSTLGVVSVWLSRSLFVPGRHLKKGGSPPSPPPPALGSHTRVATKSRAGFRSPASHTRVATKTRVGFHSPASHTRVATGRAERDAPTLKFFFFFFWGGGGVRSGRIFGGGGGGERYLGRGLDKVGGSRIMGVFEGRGNWAGVEREVLGEWVFSGGEVLGSGFWVGWGM